MKKLTVCPFEHYSTLTITYVKGKIMFSNFPSHLYQSYPHSMCISTPLIPTHTGSCVSAFAFLTPQSFSPHWHRVIKLMALSFNVLLCGFTMIYLPYLHEYFQHFGVTDNTVIDIEKNASSGGTSLLFTEKLPVKLLGSLCFDDFYHSILPIYFPRLSLKLQAFLQSYHDFTF